MTSRRAAIAVAALSLTVVAGCTQVVSGSGRPANPSGTGSAPTFPSPTSPGAVPTSPGAVPTSPTTPGSGGRSATATVEKPSATPSTGATAVVSCPTVSDTVAGIRYACLTAGMTPAPASGYSANVQLVTESSPAWVMSESSLRIDAVDADSLETAVSDQLDEFLATSYPGGSTGKETEQKSITIGGKPAFFFAGLITVDKSDAEYKSLKANQDRVVAIAIVRGDGTAAMMIMAVPDTNKALWPKMDAIATSAQLI